MIKFKYYLIAVLFPIFIACGPNQEIVFFEGEKQVKDITSFSNPILTWGADPWVIEHDDQYYYTHTTGHKLELRQTSSMENLSSTTPVTIWVPPVGEDYSMHIWAP